VFSSVWGGDRRKSFIGKTRQEVARRLAQAIRDRDKGLPIVGFSPSIDPRTFMRYETLVRVHIVPKRGTTSLAKLSPQQVQALYAEKRKEGLA
jgi:hypothetical protein